MKTPTRPTSWIAAHILLLTAAAFALVWVATSFSGPGISPDSASYLAAADGLLHGEGFVDLDGSPFVDWPPLLPGLIALASWPGGDRLMAARTLNAALYAGTVGLVAWWLLGRIRSRGLAVAAGFALVGAAPVLRSATYVWSEALFIFLTVVALAALDRACASHRRVDILVTLLACGLAWLTRYLGAVLWLYCVACLSSSAIRKREQIWMVVTAAMLSALPIAAWLLRNVLLTGQLTGERADGVGVGWSDVARLARTSARWHLPDGIGDAALPLFLLAGGLGLRRLLRARHDDTFERRARRSSIVLLSGFCVVYAASVLVLVQRIATDGIGYRLLAPLALPLACVVFLALEALRHEAAAAGRVRLVQFTIVAGLGLAVKPIATSIGIATQLHREGTEQLAVAPATLGEVNAFLDRGHRSARVYSNLPEALYLSAGQRARLSPRRRVAPASRQPTDDLRAFGEDWKRADGMLLVWFPTGNRGFLHEPRSLFDAAMLEASPVWTFEGADGRVEVYGNGAWRRTARAAEGSPTAPSRAHFEMEPGPAARGSGR